MNLYRFLVSHANHPDPFATRLLNDAKVLGFNAINCFECHSLYFIKGDLTVVDQQRLVDELLHDPVTQICQPEARVPDNSYVIETVLRPGVTDPVADQILRATELLGIKGVGQVATGQRFVVHSSRVLSEKELHTLAQRLLANAVIHYYALGAIDTVHFPTDAAASEQVEIIPIRQLSDDQLLQLSRDRRAALDLIEMQTVQKYYQTQQRDPTDVEFETIAQTWSEHCSHKTFRADIKFNDQTIHGLLKTYIRAATETINASWVVSAFVDNAGIVEFDDEYQVSFKAETHNHPSAIEPFGGSNTGLGGVIRDVLGVSAKPIAATDVFCFGPQSIDMNSLPEGTLHPRLIRSGVVAGVQDYGNKTGIPTVNGGVYYDAGYTANPLVYCGCVGLIPKNKHPRQPQSGDHVIILGGRTGRDGLRGATFSSMTMDAQTGEVAGASVQIGDPIIAKGLIEVITRARDLNLYHAITDCGAGGLSSAVGEMGSEIGADVDLINVKLKYPGLAPWEIWLSEAQERMALAVPAKNISALQKICDIYEIELTDIGTFTNTNVLTVRYDQKTVLQLNNEFLFDGMPKKEFVINAKLSDLSCQLGSWHPEDKDVNSTMTSSADISAMLLKLLSHPNIASKAEIIRRYDHEVQGGTVVKPLTGIQNDGPSDACVLKPQGTKGVKGIVLSNGLNPELGKYDAYNMAISVVDEAVRNAVAVGANPDRIAVLDNFCWGDPKRPETLAALVDCSRGCHDAAIHYKTPFISGKDSLNNEYIGSDGQRHAIPGTLLLSALGIIEDINHAVTMDFKQAGNIIYLLGETKSEFGGSYFNLCGGEIKNSPVPGMPHHAPQMYRNLHQAIKNKLVRACHDLSEGGLAVAIAEMCIGGRLGAELTFNTDDVVTALFSESNGRLLVEVQPEQAKAFEKMFADKLITKLGQVTETTQLVIKNKDSQIASLPVNNLVNAWLNPQFN